MLLFQNKFVEKVVDDYKQEEDVGDKETHPANKEYEVKNIRIENDHSDLREVGEEEEENEKD